MEEEKQHTVMCENENIHNLKIENNYGLSDYIGRNSTFV